MQIHLAHLPTPGDRSYPPFPLPFPGGFGRFTGEGATLKRNARITRAGKEESIMARNVPKQEGSTETTPETVATPPTAIPGGATGVLPLPGEAAASAAKIAPQGAPREGEPKHDMFVVEIGGQIMYQGVRSTIRPGKIVHAGCYNLDYLRAQGIRLRKLADNEVPPPMMSNG